MRLAPCVGEATSTPPSLGWSWCSSWRWLIPQAKRSTGKQNNGGPRHRRLVLYEVTATWTNQRSMPMRSTATRLTSGSASMA